MITTEAKQKKLNNENINAEKKSSAQNSEGYSAILKNKNFLFLWLGQVFSQLGDRVTFVVFVAVIASSFSASTSLQSYLYVAFTIPAVLLTAVAGVFVDRWNKKYTLIATNVLRALLLIFLPVLDKTLFGIYALAFMVSSVTQFFVPAEASSIPMLVQKKHLLSANSLFTTTMMGSLIFGFVLGDPLINICGLKHVHFAVSGLFIISAVVLLFINYKNNNVENLHHKNFKEFFDEFKQGFVYVKNKPIVLNAIIKLAILFSLIIMLSILAISISQQLLYPDNTALGAQKFVYIVAASGIGMIIGAFCVGKFWRKKSKYKLIFSGFTLVGINLALLTLIGQINPDLHFKIPNYNIFGIYLESFNLTYRMIYSYVVALFIGFGCSLIAIPVQTILHSSVSENVRGKVFGVQFTVISTSSTLPAIIAAVGADSIGLVNMLIILSLPITLFGFWGLSKKLIRNLIKKNNLL